MRREGFEDILPFEYSMHLITTALKDTQKENQRVLFAGEWCRLYSDESYWKKLDCEVFPYHWLDRGKLYEDIKDLEAVYEEYLEKLSVNLNRIHSINFSKEYWRIIIGPWLQDFIELLFDNYEVITRIDRSGLVKSTDIINIDWELCVPKNMVSFQELYSTPYYSHFLFGEIIKLSSGISWKGVECKHSIVVSKTMGNKSFKNTIVRAFKYISSFLYSSMLMPKKMKEVVFVSSYFGNNDLKLIQKKLCQFSFRHLFDPVPPMRKINKKARGEIFQKSVDTNAFKALLNELIPKQIPMSYVEGYSLYSKFSYFFFPRNPKVIFTSNAFYFNEAFKIWSAREVNNGAKLLISQHGGNGTSLWCHTEDHQIKISNRFYTWGWGDNIGNRRKMPSPKLEYTKKLIHVNLTGKVLCVVTSDIVNYMHTQQSMPLDKQFKEYIDDLIDIPNLINDESIKSNFKFRLYHTNYNRHTWGVKDKFADAGLQNYIDKSGESFYSQVSQSRLAIITYNPNATAFETLSANFPTLLFWNPRHWELRKDAQEYYDLLEKVGIYHKSKESLVEKIEEIYFDIEGWWFSNSVQSAVNIFCDNYAYTSDECIDKWVEEFKDRQK